MGSWWGTWPYITPSVLSKFWFLYKTQGERHKNVNRSWNTTGACSLVSHRPQVYHLRLDYGQSTKIEWFCDFRIFYLPYIIPKYHGKTFCHKSLDFVTTRFEKKLSEGNWISLVNQPIWSWTWVFWSTIAQLCMTCAQHHISCLTRCDKVGA